MRQRQAPLEITHTPPSNRKTREAASPPCKKDSVDLASAWGDDCENEDGIDPKTGPKEEDDVGGQWTRQSDQSVACLLPGQFRHEKDEEPRQERQLNGGPRARQEGKRHQW